MLLVRLRRARLRQLLMSGDTASARQLVEQRAPQLLTPHAPPAAAAGTAAAAAAAGTAEQQGQQEQQQGQEEQQGGKQRFVGDSGSQPLNTQHPTVHA